MPSGPGARRCKSRSNSANNDTIVASFPVEAEGKDRSTVILVTPMFTTEIADLSVKGAVGGTALCGRIEIVFVGCEGLSNRQQSRFVRC